MRARTAVETTTSPTPVVVRTPLYSTPAEPRASPFEAARALAIARDHLAAARVERDGGRRRHLLMFAGWALDDARDAASDGTLRQAVDEALAVLGELERDGA